MSRFFSLLLVGLVFTAITSCGDDDDTFVFSEDVLVGTWNVDDLSGDGSVTATVLGQSESSTVEVVTDNSTATITFTSSPNEFTSAGSITVTSTETSSGTMDSTTETSPAFGSGTWRVVNATTLEVTDQGETTVFTVDPSSSSNSLVLVNEIDESIDLFGTTIRTVLTTTTRLTR
ncbi:MAG: hypothetical protein AAFP08_00580 [Bacteroidota bacterium]